MKKLVSLLLSLCLVLSLSAIPAMAAPADLSGLIEESLTREASYAITKNLTLPQTLEDGTAITWKSSNPNAISIQGVVTRQITDTDVTLTASVAGEEKELKFTVIGKGKKVWYSENFNVPQSELGVELTNRQIAPTDISVEYKAATETDPGRAGFVNFLGNAKDFDIISVQKNPLVTAGDGSLCIERIEDANNNSNVAASFQFPSLTTDDLPGGNIKLFIRVISPETIANGACQLNFGFTNSSDYDTYISGTNMTYRYSLYSGIYNGAASKEMASGLTPSNGYYSNLIEYDTNYNTGKGKITSVTDATLKNYEITFTPDETKKTKGLYIATTKTTAAQKAYIDDVVIMTDEIDASTDAEGVEIYKALLTDAFETEVADFNNITTDFSLDLVNVDGYSVSWVSSNESIIKIDSVNKKADVQLSEIIRPVTLTATITKGEATETAAFNLTVVPYGSTIESYKAEGIKGIIDYTGYAREAEYSSADASRPYKHDNNNVKFNVVKDPVTQNEYVKVNNSYFFQYVHSGDSSNALKTDYTTYSVDLKFEEPDTPNRTSENYVQINGNSTSIMGKVFFCYEYDKEGNRSKWIKLMSGTNEILVKDPAIVPDSGEWINLQIVVNREALKYDVYINGVKINNKALDFPTSGYNYLYNFAFVKAANSSALYIDNIQVRTSDASTYVKPGAELMNASIGSFSDALAATGTNGSTITWAASGDGKIENGALVKTKAFGLGKAVATASVTTAQGTLSRPSAIEYGTAIKEINNDGAKLTSVIYSAESAGKGYIALYNNEDRLLDVASFDVTAGTDEINFVNKALPAGYDSCKAFVWTSGLKPLGYVYP